MTTVALSLTSWLDPALSYFAIQSGIPVDQYSSQVGGEGIGVALETAADMFTKGWLNKAVQSIAGAIASGYAIWGKDVPIRLRRELLALGTHELLRVADPSPKDIVEARQSLERFISYASRGDWNAALSTVLTTPAEFQSMFGVVRTVTPSTVTQGATQGGGVSVKPVVSPEKILIEPTAKPDMGGRYQIVEEEKLPYFTAPQGRYMVTG